MLIVRFYWDFTISTVSHGLIRHYEKDNGSTIENRDGLRGGLCRPGGNVLRDVEAGNAHCQQPNRVRIGA